MIYLIGGSSRCGKTILSKKIASKKKISFISTDSLRPIVLEILSKKELKSKFPQTNMPTPKNKFRFDLYPAKDILDAQVVEAKIMWPPIKAFITSLIFRDRDYVIEGLHLLPGLVNQLKRTKYWKDIKVVYLIKTDLIKIQSGFSKNIREFDWMYPLIKNDKDRLLKASEMVSSKGQYIAKEAIKFDLKLYNTEDSFNKTLKEAEAYLFRK